MLKKLGKLLGVSALFILAVSLISTVGPTFHREIVRSYVGERVVKITGERSGGTGFVVKAPSGREYIMTNHHVCKLADANQQLNVFTNGSTISIKRKVLYVYDNHDLCLLESIEGISGLSISNSLSVGQTIGLIGHPKLWPLTLNVGEFIGYRNIQLGEIVKTAEECSGKLQEVPNMFTGEIILICIEEMMASQLMVYSRGGSSGSPVVSFFGSVVGVLFAGNPGDQFESFAVPLNEIRSFLKNK